MALRDILAKAKLDPVKMAPYEKNKLYIITGVVYSEKLEISGERQTQNAVDGQFQILPRVQWASGLTNIRGAFSEVNRDIYFSSWYLARALWSVHFIDTEQKRHSSFNFSGHVIKAMVNA